MLELEDYGQSLSVTEVSGNLLDLFLEKEQ